MKLQLVCRGSKAEGLGHLFRARTFARIAATAHDIELIAIVEKDLEVILADLPCSVQFARCDLDVLPLVRVFAPDVLAFDLTRIDADVFQTARCGPRLTVSLSPVFDQMRDVDVLFTRSARTPEIPGVRLFAGLSYAVFGEQCRPIDDAAYERALSQDALPIAVCMGGADAANKTFTVVQSLLDIETSCVIWVLLGEGYAHSYSDLVDAARGDRRHEVILAKTNRSMWHVLGNCGLAILAGGLTTVEAVYAGLPSINLFERREHWEMVEELFDAGVCLNGGLFSARSLAVVTSTIDALDRDRDRLRRMRERCRGLIDGRGSQRIIAEMERLLAECESRAIGRREHECVPQPC